MAAALNFGYLDLTYNYKSIPADFSAAALRSAAMAGCRGAQGAKKAPGGAFGSV
jgi:hypothetical protein